MHHWLDSWPIHLLSIPRCQSVIRFPDSCVTPLEDLAAAPVAMFTRAANALAANPDNLCAKVSA